MFDSNKSRSGWTDDAAEPRQSGWRWGSGASKTQTQGHFNPPTLPAGPVSGRYQDGGTEIPDKTKELYGILVVQNGPRRFDIHKIAQRQVKIGRKQGDILIEDSAVSTQHAVLAVFGNDSSDAEFRLLDRDNEGLPTKSGTRINARNITTESVLKDRDRIQIGETDLLFVQLWP